MTITFKKLTPNIMVEDVNATLQFYREVLGFEVITTVPESGTFDWAMIQRDSVPLMFQSRSSLTGEIPFFTDRPIGASLTLYIDVADIHALYDSVKEHVTITQDMHSTFYGAQEFAIQDLNGYILAFAQQPE
jgi:lactoylglutathione lyase